jgi:hypothetical protein
MLLLLKLLVVELPLLVIQSIHQLLSQRKLDH